MLEHVTRQTWWYNARENGEARPETARLRYVTHRHALSSRRMNMRQDEQMSKLCGTVVCFKFIKAQSNNKSVILSKIYKHPRRDASTANDWFFRTHESRMIQIMLIVSDNVSYATIYIYIKCVYVCVRVYICYSIGSKKCSALHR